MKTMHYTLATGLVALLALAGCADPSDQTPAAEVRESTTPAPAANAPEAEAEAEAEGTVYTITPASSIEFTGSKVTGSHEGGFKAFDGTIHTPGEDLTRATIDVTIDMHSVYTDTDNLTKHLMSADFFEVETYPEARFVSTGIAKDGDQYKVTGDFTLHGVTKSITFPATLGMADGTVTANAEFDINRMDFGVSYAGKSDDLIRENVVIRLDIEAAE